MKWNSDDGPRAQEIPRLFYIYLILVLLIYCSYDYDDHSYCIISFFFQLFPEKWQLHTRSLQIQVFIPIFSRATLPWRNSLLNKHSSQRSTRCCTSLIYSTHRSSPCPHHSTRYLTNTTTWLTSLSLPPLTGHAPKSNLSARTLDATHMNSRPKLPPSYIFHVSPDDGPTSFWEADSVLAYVGAYCAA